MSNLGAVEHIFLLTASWPPDCSLSVHCQCWAVPSGVYGRGSRSRLCLEGLLWPSFASVPSAPITSSCGTNSFSYTLWPLQKAPEACVLEGCLTPLLLASQLFVDTSWPGSGQQDHYTQGNQRHCSLRASEKSFYSA